MIFSVNAHEILFAPCSFTSPILFIKELVTLLSRKGIHTENKKSATCIASSCSTQQRLRAHLCFWIRKTGLLSFWIQKTATYVGSNSEYVSSTFAVSIGGLLRGVGEGQ
ncbi:unnamed protein product [Heligmosomoides polygyrus]|uniref:Reverse transcriptase domain-containing protein n=1 Tax=Heligmosomoides polygyrus TaxID=6339 RepID=A0A183GB19_HELPZ|nr:unnamed protein product [Heligmosomoides polygyrus]